MPARAYLAAEEVQLALGGNRTTRLEDYDRAIIAATSQIDRWTGRRFLRDSVSSAREFQAVSCHRVCVGDFIDPDSVVVETDDLGDGVWSTWLASEWHPESDDRGNGRYVRLDGEPWRWVAASGTREFPTSGSVSRVRVTTRWGWDEPPYPVLQACMQLSILYFQSKDRASQLIGGDPIMEAKGLLMDYAVEGGTLYCRPLVG